MASQTDVANLKLVDMEHRAFDLVHHGQLEQARAVLFSPAYEEQKQVYAAGITHLLEELNKQWNAKLHSKETDVRLSILSTGVVLAALLVVWFTAMRTLTCWRTAFRHAHDSLETRVQERTAQLTDEITVRRRAEEQSRLQSTALEAAANAIVITDCDGTIRWVNPAFTTLTGYTREEVIGTNSRVLKSGKHDAAFYAELWRTVKAGTVWHGELINRRKDDSEYAEEMTITPLRNERGEIINFIAIKQDITGRKQGEEKLQEREATLRGITDSAQDAILMMDPQGHVSYWNPAAEHILGYTRNEALGQNLHELLAPQRYQDAHQKAFPEFQRTGHGNAVGKTLELDVRCKDGREILVELSLSAVQIKGGWHAVGIIRDITERKRAEAALESMHRQLLDTSRQAGMAEVATNVLHNVGNVLNSVNVSTALISEKVRESKVSSLAKAVALMRGHQPDLAAFLTQDPKGVQLCDYLHNLAQYLSNEQLEVVKEIESLSANVEHIKEIVTMQQNYAKASGFLETLPIVDLVEDTLRMNNGALARHGAQVIRDYTATPLVPVDKHKVLQILVNLVRNAKYALDEGGGDDKRLTVRVATDREGFVKISVVDNGVGIPAVNLTRIFEHGFTTRKDGHGFGLHSGALAAKEMGGSLSVHSEGPGQGATFTLSLPLHQEHKER